MSETNVDSGGWWDAAAEMRFDPDVERKLRRAVDRMLEASYFLRQLAELPVAPDAEALREANWLFSAHVTAVIAVRDCAEIDFRLAGSDAFRETELKREFYLESEDTRGSLRDPSAVNRGYMDMRNMRVHLGTALVEQDDRLLAQDIALQAPPRRRWFIKQIDASERSHLSKPGFLSAVGIAKFNERARRQCLIRIAAHHIALLGRFVTHAARAM